MSVTIDLDPSHSVELLLQKVVAALEHRHAYPEERDLLGDLLDVLHEDGELERVLPNIYAEDLPALHVPADTSKSKPSTGALETLAECVARLDFGDLETFFILVASKTSIARQQRMWHAVGTIRTWYL